MVVLVLTACSPGLRGHVTRWLLEVSPGVFVGHVSARVRDRLWERTVSLTAQGRALMVFTCRNEQRFDFRVHCHEWEVVDMDGLNLIRRPSESSGASTLQPGWSLAAKRRRYRR